MEERTRDGDRNVEEGGNQIFEAHGSSVLGVIGTTGEVLKARFKSELTSKTGSQIQAASS